MLISIIISINYNDIICRFGKKKNLNHLPSIQSRSSIGIGAAFLSKLSDGEGGALSQHWLLDKLNTQWGEITHTSGRSEIGLVRD
jgi:hypothetical protein